MKLNVTFEKNIYRYWWNIWISIEQQNFTVYMCVYVLDDACIIQNLLQILKHGIPYMYIVITYYTAYRAYY